MGAPYNVNLSEVTQIGTKVLRVEAVDSDQRGPFSTVEYQLEYEKNQDHYFEVDSDGRVTLLKSLDYEDVAHIKVQNSDSPLQSYVFFKLLSSSVSTCICVSAHLKIKNGHRLTLKSLFTHHQPAENFFWSQMKGIAK